MYVSMFQVATAACVAALLGLATATFAGGHSAGISSFPVSKHGPVGYHGPLAKPVVQKDGHLADTIEVAAARGEHLIAVAKAHSTAGYGSDDDYGSADHGSLYDPSYEGALHGIYSHGPSTGDIYKGDYGYAGLQSFSTDHSYGHQEGFGGQDAGYDGASAGYGSQSAGYASGRLAYHGQLAAPIVLKSGYLADTQDVAAAKGAHYVALSMASKHGGHH